MDVGYGHHSQTAAYNTGTVALAYYVFHEVVDELAVVQVAVFIQMVLEHGGDQLGAQ